MKRLFQLIFLALLVPPQAGFARTFEASDALKVIGVAKPQISPDGTLVAIIVSRADIATNNSTSELRIIDARSSNEVFALAPNWEVGETRWAPDGRHLAILAKNTDQKDAIAQIYVTDMRAPPVRITAASEKIIQLAWSPDGTQIAYGREEPLMLPRSAGTLLAFEVKEGGYVELEPRRPAHLWLAKADGSGDKRLTSGDWTLQIPYKGSGPAMLPFSWFPDGRRIVIATQASPDVDLTERELRTVDAATGQTALLIGAEMRAINPTVSPDGRRVAYWQYPRTGDAFSFAVRTVDVATGRVRREGPSPLDRNLTLSIWMPKGDQILVGGHNETRTALWMQRGTATPVRLPTGDLDLVTRYRVAADVAKTGAIAFVASKPQSPPELYVMAGPMGKPRQVTHYNDDIRAIELGHSTVLEWRMRDGFRANGVVTYPPDFQPGHRYPLVVMPHGGPMQASMLGWGGFVQEMAARGWIVFEPNYRGSDNLGRAYQAAIIGDMGDGPGRDVMSGLEALKAQGSVDERRIAVTGESYGGYMAAWLIGHYSGWNSAVLAAALVDTADSYDLADAGKTASGRLAGASPWEPGGQEAHRRQSPLYSFASVKTPTLILSTIFDHRVPVASSQRMFHALRENKVETRFIAYPVEGHGTSDPLRELDWNKRWIDWISEHFDRVEPGKDQ